MPVENDPSARMQVRTMGELMHPASCMVCGNGTCELGYLDLGVFFDYEGTMYLCLTCVTEAGETIGMFRAEEVKHIQDIAEANAQQLITLRAELDRVKPIADAVSNLFAGSSVAPVRVSSGGPLTEAVSLAATDITGINQGPADGEPVIEESVTLSGSSNAGGSQLRNITFD